MFINTRQRCKSCGWIGLFNESLQAANPFDPEDNIVGCPKCKEVNPFETLCDVEGCKELYSSGTPTESGYRWTCHKHRPTT